MTRLDSSLVFLCFSLASGCAGRALDLDRSAPAAEADADPSVLKTPVDHLMKVWVDDQRCYWHAEFGIIQSCLKTDCEHTILSYSKDRYAWLTPAVGDGHVFWNSSNSIFACPAEGCAAQPVTVTQDPALASIFANRDYVYWGSDYDIYRCPASGCGATPEVVARDAVADQLVFYQTRAYWMTRDGIVSVPLDGAEPPKLVTQTTDPVPGAEIEPFDSFAIADGYIYLAAGKRIYRYLIASSVASPPSVLVTADNSVSELRVDDSGLYWVEANAIHFCPLTGCEQSVALTPPKVLPMGNSSQSPHFALDASDVYWIEADLPDSKSLPRSGKAIRKTAK